MIKALFENLNPQTNTSFLVNTFILDKFTVPYHFHPEYELTLIVNGNGKRYVGKNMENFSSGDLVFLGPDLPHSWKSDELIKSDSTVKSIVIQFEKSFLGPEFFTRPELTNILNLMKLSACGIRFINETASEIRIKMELLAQQENVFRKMMLLLDILESLAESKNYLLLDKDEIMAHQPNNSKERINAALGYIVDNFQNEILLNKVAAAVNMTPNAFCKYFRRVTNKTFIETVIDYRINFAIQQLLATDKPIAEIAFESGFGDVSHFYKLFKRRMKMSPLSYRKSFLGGL